MTDLDLAAKIASHRIAPQDVAVAIRRAVLAAVPSDVHIGDCPLVYGLLHPLYRSERWRPIRPPPGGTP